MEIKQAEAAKKAAIGRNDAQKEVALSNAELAVTQANADKQAGEAAAKSEAAVQTAREIAQKEVEEAKARKVESSLKLKELFLRKSPDRKLFFRQMPSLKRLPAKRKHAQRLL